MLARYLVLPGFLLELAWAFRNSSSIPVSTSTLETTSFLTVTAPAPTTSANSSVNGTGLDYASSCNSAKLEWVDTRGQTYVSNTTFTTSTSSVSYTIVRSGWIETYGPTEVYTLCDGYPRMNASTEFKTTETTPEKTIWSTFATQTEVYRNVSAPTCTIGPKECSALESEYSISLQAYSDYLSTNGAPSVDYPTSPICGSATLPPELSMTLAPAACMYNHATIQLLYWPVSTVGNHICGNNWTIVEATPTIPGQPNTAFGFNTTFTSPTVYMVLSGAYEVGSDFATGTAINGILPMPSDRVSSMCALEGGGMGPPEAMDYADFDAPIPASKYRCQPACWTKPDYPQSWQNSAYNITATENLCSTIYDQAYRPALQVPVEQFNSFYGNFTNGVGLDFGSMQCSFRPATDGIFFDPPSALQQVQSAVGPSVPNSPGATTTAKEDPQTTPASPGPTVPTALPQTTDGGNGVPQPTQPSNPDSSGGNDNDDNGNGEGDPSTPGSNGGDGDGDNAGGNDGSSGGDNNGGSNRGSGDGDSDNGGSDDGGGDDSGSGSGGNGDGGSDNNGGSNTPSDDRPGENVGDAIASLIGMTRPSAANPAPAEQTPSPDGQGSGQDPSGPSDLADGASEPSPNDGPGQPTAAPSQGVVLTDSTGQILTAVRSGDNVVLPSATVPLGQATSIAGLGSLSAGTDRLVQDGQTVSYPIVAPASPSAGVYGVDGQTYTADGSGNVVVALGVTLTAGGAAAIVSGTTYSLGASSGGAGGVLVVDGVTATAGGAGGTGVSDGVVQQTGNAAASERIEDVQFGIAVALVALGLPDTLVAFSVNLDFKDRETGEPISPSYLDEDDTEHVEHRLDCTRRIYAHIFANGASHPRIVSYRGPTATGYKLQCLHPGLLMHICGLRPASTCAKLLALYQRWALQVLSALVFLHNKGVVLNTISNQVLELREDLSVAVAGLVNAACAIVGVPTGSSAGIYCFDNPWEATNHYTPEGLLERSSPLPEAETGCPRKDLFDWATWVHSLMTHADPAEHGWDATDETAKRSAVTERWQQIERLKFRNWPTMEEGMLGSVVVHAWQGVYTTAEEALEDARRTLEATGTALSAKQSDELAGIEWRSEFTIRHVEKDGDGFALFQEQEKQ